MAWGDISSFMSGIGSKISQLSSSVFQYLSSQGPSKIATILVFLVFSYLTIKIIERPIKWAIVVLFIMLAISVGLSFAS